MNEAQMRQLWGEHNRVNRTVTAGGILDQWGYDAPSQHSMANGTPNHNGDYLYFRDGVLIAIQERNPR
jgi:hypothetical protein